METAERMRKRHKQELASLQETCRHPKVSGWVTKYWAPAHSTGFQIKVCKTCEKVLARRTACRKCGKLTEDPRNGMGTHSRPYGSHYCPDCVERTEEEVKSDEKLAEESRKFIAKNL